MGRALVGGKLRRVKTRSEGAEGSWPRATLSETLQSTQVRRRARLSPVRGCVSATQLRPLTL